MAHQGSREPLREIAHQPALVVRADIANEQLRAQVNKLQYELETIRHDRELNDVQHQAEKRKLEQRAEADFKRASTFEAECKAAVKRRDDLVAKHRHQAEQHSAEKSELDRTIRDLQTRNQELQEEVDEAGTSLSAAGRQSEHAFKELERKYTAIQTSVSRLEEDVKAKVAQVQTAQQKLSTRERDVGDLEAKVIKLEAQTRDSESVALIKRELSGQVAHIRKLETTNRQQTAELRRLKEAQKAVQVVEEEKRELSVKVRMMEDLRRELAEAQLQRQIMEDEKRRWTSYLERQTTHGSDAMEFTSPEDMAKAFVAERIERLSLVDRLGALKPELAVRDESIKSLQAEKTRLMGEVQRVKGLDAAMSEDKIRSRLERQRNLAVKEVAYLRAQIKAFEAEEGEFGLGNKDESVSVSKRVSELEALLDEYRDEINRLHEALRETEAEKTTTHATGAISPKKRPVESDVDDERLGELTRKMRALQNDLEQADTRNRRTDSELQATISQLSALRESSRTRVLEVRDNPTARTEVIKLETLRVLREENAELLLQLEGKSPSTKVVPQSTLASVKLQLADLQTQLDRQLKKEKRLKTIWSLKFGEYTNTIESIFGWRVTFMPNGLFKIIPSIYKTHVNARGEEEENSISFDGEKSTMRVSGGEQSAWAAEIRQLVEYWVDGRKQIPCFLAAMMLDLHEKRTE